MFQHLIKFFGEYLCMQVSLSRCLCLCLYLYVCVFIKHVHQTLERDPIWLFQRVFTCISPSSSVNGAIGSLVKWLAQFHTQQCVMTSEPTTPFVEEDCEMWLKAIQTIKVILQIIPPALGCFFFLSMSILTVKQADAIDTCRSYITVWLALTKYHFM